DRSRLGRPAVAVGCRCRCQDVAAHRIAKILRVPAEGFRVEVAHALLVVGWEFEMYYWIHDMLLMMISDENYCSESVFTMARPFGNASLEYARKSGGASPCT